MTSEREAEIRRESKVRADDCGRYAREVLAALDAARAETTALRGRVEGLGVELRETVAAGDPERYACDKAFKTVLTRGRELGLWEE